MNAKFEEAIALCRSILSNRAGFESTEIEYKQVIAQRIRLVFAAIEEGDQFLPLLRKAFGSPNNLTAWQSHSKFLKWAEQTPDTVRQALPVLSTADLSIEERVNRFLDVLPNEVEPNLSNRITLASFFLMGLDPSSYPVFRVTAYKTVERVLSWPEPPAGASPGTLYAHHCTFTLHFLKGLQEAGLDARNMLDAQSLIWTLATDTAPGIKAWREDLVKEGLRDGLEAILARYSTARASETFGRQHELWSIFERLQSLLMVLDAVKKYPSIKITWSMGKGNWAKIPWITLLDTRETVTTQQGVYCVFLFRQNMSGVYLTLAQGVTEPRKLYGGIEAQRYLRSRAEAVRKQCQDLTQYGFSLDDQIDLQTDPGLGADYEDSTIAYKFYPAGLIPDDSTLVPDLEAVLATYERYVNSTSSSDAASKSYWIFQANPKIYDLTGALTRLSNMTWLVRQHATDIKPGDTVFLWESGNDAGLVAVATVLSPPMPLSEEEDSLPFMRDQSKLGGVQPRVKLRIDHVLQERIRRSDLLIHPILGELTFLKAPQGTNFAVSAEHAAALMALIDGTLGSAAEVMTQNALHRLADELLVGENFIQSIVDVLYDKRQIIFYGPPGTGKTFIARKLMQCLAPTETCREVVQFHPSYSYEDFVHGYRPMTKNGQLVYELKPGPFMQLAERASKSTASHILLIDEINRGNLPRILGELLYLLEYRDDEVSLMYGEEDSHFVLPKNLLIIGTMNTADRSIALVDAALRRRFHFIPLFPNQPPLDGLLKRWLQRHRPDMVWIADIVDRLNGKLRERFGPHLQIGHSYFLRKDLSNVVLHRIWDYDIMPFLEDQLFGQEQELENFSLDRLRES